MTYEPEVLDLPTVRLASARLLTASSPDRFAVSAEALSLEPTIRTALGVDSGWLTRALTGASRLWQRLYSSPQRTPEEAELAALLPLLAGASSPAVDGFLRRIALHDKPSVAWVAALARSLARKRSSNLNFKLTMTGEFPVIVEPFGTNASLQQDSLFDLLELDEPQSHSSASDAYRTAA